MKDCICINDEYLDYFKLGDKYQYSKSTASWIRVYSIPRKIFDFYSFPQDEFDKHFRLLSDIREEKLNKILT